MSSPKDPSLIHQKTTKEEEMSNVDVFLAMAPHLSPIDPKGSNFAFSPLSLRTLVSLIAAGATGPTLQQLLSFLKSDSIDEVNARSSELVSSVLTDAGVLKISFANALLIKEGLPLKHPFKQVLDNVYKASSFQVDFVNTEAAKIISEVNSWSRDQTYGLINEILPSNSADKSTVLILANALYFKGNWEECYFKASSTKEYDFHLLGGDSVKVRFMRSFVKHYIGTYDGFKVLRLPYKREIYDERRFSMYILLPDAKDGLYALVEKLVSEPDFLDRHLPYEKVGVNDFRLPKFNISFGFEASEILKQFGLTLLFNPLGLNPPPQYGLTEMVDSRVTLVVSKMYHKCFIEVNEEGTEAAAVSVARFIATCGYPRPTPRVDFVADHPFMFLIREDTTGAVLFFGHVLNPLNK